MNAGNAESEDVETRTNGLTADYLAPAAVEVFRRLAQERAAAKASEPNTTRHSPPQST
jgi:hypothetical protein